MMKREVCKACGRISRVGFSVPKEMWESVVPPNYQDEVVCLSCFTEWADDAFVAWDEQIALFPVSLRSHLQVSG